MENHVIPFNALLYVDLDDTFILHCSKICPPWNVHIMPKALCEPGGYYESLEGYFRNTTVGLVIKYFITSCPHWMFYVV